MTYLSTFQVKPFVGFDVVVAPWRSDKLRAQLKHEYSVQEQYLVQELLLLNFTSIRDRSTTVVSLLLLLLLLP